MVGYKGPLTALGSSTTSGPAASLQSNNNNGDMVSITGSGNGTQVESATSGQAIEMKEVTSDMKKGSSVDSSDTFASCQTHPFMSTEELESNVYVNPFSSSKESLGWGGSPKHQLKKVQGAIGAKRTCQMKTSCSGEADLIRCPSPARSRRTKFQRAHPSGSGSQQIADAHSFSSGSAYHVSYRFVFALYAACISKSSL